MTLKLLLEIAFFSVILSVNGQFQHFPVQSGRPDSQNVRPQSSRTVSRPKPPSPPPPPPPPAASFVADQFNEVEREVPSTPVNRNRGRGRTRGSQSTPKVNQDDNRTQRIRVPERNKVPSATRSQSVRVPERRPQPEPTTTTTPQRPRIRIRPKTQEVAEAPSNIRQRQRTEIITARPPPREPVTQPAPVTARNRVPIQDEQSKQTFNQALSGIFDPSSLTVFSDNKIAPVREEPRFISQEIPQQQFQIPQVSRIRTLAEPKVVNAASNSVDQSDIKQELDQTFVPVQELAREKQNGATTFQQPASSPFSVFQANPTQPTLKPIPFQAQPQFQQEIRQPQPIPFNTRPAVPAPVPSRPAPVPQRPAPIPQRPAPVPQRPAPVPQRQAPVPQKPAPIPQRTTSFSQPPAPVPTPQQTTPTDIFEGRPSLFSQPIEIPSDAGGASFSYEAIIGK